MTLLPAPPPTFRRSHWRLAAVGALTVLTTGVLIAVAGYGQVLRGVSFTPGTGASGH